MTRKIKVHVVAKLADGCRLAIRPKRESDYLGDDATDRDWAHPFYLRSYHPIGFPPQDLETLDGTLIDFKTWGEAWAYAQKLAAEGI